MAVFLALYLEINQPNVVICECQRALYGIKCVLRIF